MATLHWSDEQLRNYDFPTQPLTCLDASDERVDEYIARGVNYIVENQLNLLCALQQ